jgi:ATP-dependent Clp protease ATP-binding subunit ClpC
MFARYTDQCKRAVFFAQQTALHADAKAIDPSHLLLGLLIEYRTGNGDIFRLRELLPEDAGHQDVIARERVLKGKIIPLSDSGKRVVAYTAREANGLRDYWIETEHLVLGILREDNNAAAARLREVGLELQLCRQRVIDSRSSRPARPNPVIWWVRQRSLSVILPAVFVLGIIVALSLLGFGAR